MVAKGSAVEKTTYRVLKLRDGRLLVESPQRIKKNGQEATEMLVINKESCTVQDRKVAYPATADVAASYEIHAVIGVIELCFAKYLLVATQRSLVATVQSHKIWRITRGQAIPIGTSVDTQVVKAKETLDEQSLAKYTLDQDLLDNITQIVNSGHLYYSTTYDLTHSIQHNYLTATGKAHKTVSDDRYFFNSHVQRSLLAHPDMVPWVYKVICGFAGAIDITMEGGDMSGKTYTVTLVSRLNNRRLGTRYVRRGLDYEGNAANNVEMEQIVFSQDVSKDKHISAFVQVRGSAPAIWGQELNLDYRPELLIADITKPEIWASTKKHYDDLKAQYIGEAGVNGGADHGKVICVNLLDDKGFEGRLTRTYEETVKKYGDDKITYEEFPVNKWCKKMNFRNMDILLSRVRDRLINSQFFAAEGDVPALINGPTNPSVIPSNSSFHVSRLQTGIARVSCLDSLDRTNLTCSIFARYMIPFQLQTLIHPNQAFTPVDGTAVGDAADPVHQYRVAVEPSVRILTNLWADSGDAVSLLYAGTRALKSDVTRTGKRQWLKGSLDDGLNSLTRYYLNNFSDGRKQDGYDMWCGKVSADQMRVLAETEGARKARHISRPILERGKGLTGLLLPGFVIDRVEPLLQAATEFAASTLEDQAKKAQKLQEASRTHLEVAAASSSKTVDGEVVQQGPSYVGFLVSAIKIYAPERVTSVVEFIVAMVVFFYILVIVKIFQLKGQLYVDRPKLSYEYKTIHEIVD
ncbi:Phosphatidylinositide phosphatase SAC1 [Blyttiomyces sp. JEL0837]|nr:Phosphatidylinositide phosphatase SAC1 [Blyttiomyces sp. JEL0837]